MEVNMGTLAFHKADQMMKSHSEKDDYSYSAYNSSSDEDGDYSAKYGLKIFPEEVIAAASSFQGHCKDVKVLSADALFGEEVGAEEKEDRTGTDEEEEDRSEIEKEQDREEIEEEEEEDRTMIEKDGRADIEEKEDITDIEEEEDGRSEIEEEDEGDITVIEEEDKAEIDEEEEEDRMVIEEQHSRAEAEEKEYRTEIEKEEEKNDRTEIEKEEKDRAGVEKEEDDDRTVMPEEEIKEDSSVRGAGGWFSKNKSNTVGDSSNFVETQLREALYEEQKCVDAILAELEEARNASEAAAMSSMAIITELQKQKSDLRMEAIQYYRMAEESAQHDQEAMGDLKELLLIRETEKLALEKEVETYRQRLLVQQSNTVKWNHSSKASVVTIMNPNSPKASKTSATANTNANTKPKQLGKKIRHQILERLQRLERQIHDLKVGKALQPVVHDLMLGKHVSFKETLSYAD